MYLISRLTEEQRSVKKKEQRVMGLRTRGLFPNGPSLGNNAKGASHGLAVFNPKNGAALLRRMSFFCVSDRKGAFRMASLPSLKAFTPPSESTMIPSA